jgi:hypothetical protein
MSIQSPTCFSGLFFLALGESIDSFGGVTRRQAREMIKNIKSFSLMSSYLIIFIWKKNLTARLLHYIHIYMY